MQVLEDNRQQSLCLSLDTLRCRADLEPFLALTKRLEASGLLDRQGEALPDAGVVAARPEPGLTRPELAVLMAYAKMQLCQQLLDSSLPDEPAAAALLHAYFPSLLRERFAAQLSGHPLARELTATVMANRIVNQAGATAIFALARETGAPPATVAASYLALDRLLAGDVLRAALAQAGTQLPAAERLALLLQLEETLAGLCLDALNAPVPLALADSERLAPRVAALRALPRATTALESAAEARLLAAGLAPEPVRLARDLGSFPDLLVLLDLAGSGELSPAATALAAVRESLALDTFVELTNQVPLRDDGDRRALRTLRRGIRTAAVACTRQVLASGDDCVALLAARPLLLTRFQGELARLRRLPAPRLSSLFALLHDLDDLVAVRHPGS
jgi:glutamate dehydrogenase